MTRSGRGISQVFVEEDFDPQGSAGLFVGIKRFDEGSGLGEIQYAVDDAVDLAYLFSCDLELIPPDRVHLALSGKPEKKESQLRQRILEESGALQTKTTRNRILATVEETTRSTNPDGLMIVTFATHGFSDNKTHRLVASDSERSALEKTGIDVPDILGSLLEAPSLRRILILDACQQLLTNKFARGAAVESEDFLRIFSEAKGLASLTAVGVGGIAYGDTVSRNGVFTEAILRGLRGEALADDHGFITIGTLTDYVRDRVSSWYAKTTSSPGSIDSGISQWFDGHAGRLPLASRDQEVLSRRFYKERRDLALAHLKGNIGKFITGRHYDEILDHLNGTDLEAETKLFDRLEKLDGTETTQTGFLQYYVHYWNRPARRLFQRGLVRMYGLSGTVDLEGAQKDFREAAEEDDSVTLVWTAGLEKENYYWFHLNATMTTVLDNRIVKDLKKRAHGGDLAAALVWGFAKIDGLGTSMDRVEAKLWLLKAAEAGDTVAMNCLGYLLTQKEFDEFDEEEGFRWFEKSAVMKNASAMNNLGLAYENGRGVAPNPPEAIRWYGEAARAGNRQAMINFARCYQYGVLVESDEVLALSWYRKAAEAGDPRGMADLGWLYMVGEVNVRNPALGLEWLERSVEQGHPEGMMGLAALYADGDLVPRDYSRSVQLWRRAADLGSGLAMENLGTLYENGEGVDQDSEEAMAWYQRAAEVGQKAAMTKLGHFYARGLGTGRDLARSVHWFRRASEARDAAGTLQLGICYEVGSGVEQDLSQAATFYREAAEAGDPDGMVSLGECLQNGNGIELDWEAAISWYRQAVELQNVRAMANLGLCYANGYGVPQDETQAVAWYRPAAEAGNVLALNNLGVAYWYGSGVEQDLAQAFYWIQEAASSGCAKGMCNLGVLYRDGIGVSRDSAEGRRWFELARQAGHPNIDQELQPGSSTSVQNEESRAADLAKGFTRRFIDWIQKELKD